MERKTIYKTQGTCSSFIELTEENGIIKNINFIGGCNGNLQGIGNLVKGMPPEAIISRLNGICCGNKNTSCPDQLCRALEQLQKEKDYK